MRIKAASKWEFETSWSASFSVEIVSVGTGSIYLNSPDGLPYQYFYGSAGVGAALGASLPKSVSITVGPKLYKSNGDIYILESFNGTELTYEDFTGYCTINDVSGSLGALLGGSVTAIFMGLDAADVAEEFVADQAELSPAVWYEKNLDPAGRVVFDEGGGSWTKFLETRAKAVLITESMNSPNGFGISATGSVGYIATSKENLPPKLSPEPTSDPRTSNKVMEPGPPIVLEGDALFNINKSNLKPEAVQSLQRAGQRIKSFKGRALQIAGHTDGTRNDGINFPLSKQRAESVKWWLIGAGFVSAQVKTDGLGDRYPVASNATVDGRRKNRRVEITVLPSGWKA